MAFFRLPRQKLKKRTTASLLAMNTLLASGVALTMTSTAYAESAAVEKRYYNIPAGPLSQAVNAFAAVSGMYLGGNGALLKNKKTLGFDGEYTPGQALDLLLVGTGLSYDIGDDKSIVLVDSNYVSKSADGITMAPLLVQGQQNKVEAGVQVIGQNEIESMAGANENLTDLLKGNGSVRFSRSSSSSGNSATMRPDEVSINGQSHYQNLFVIDGMSANNDLNPGNSEDSFTNPISPTNLSMLSGSSSQSFYVDPSALDSVEVYDSNVPVEFGGFMGGVVSSKLKRYDSDNYTSIKYAVSKDDWDEMHVDEDFEEDYEEGESYSGEYTPEYLKQRYTITGAQGLSEKLGLTYTASRATSNFAQVYDKRVKTKYSDVNYGHQGIEYDDTVDNIMLRFDYRANNNLNIGSSIMYANRHHDGLTSSTFDSAFIKSHKAVGINTDIEYKATNGRLLTTLSYNEASDTIESDSSTYSYHPADKTAGVWPYSGGYGNVDQQQNTTKLSVDWLQNAFQLGSSEHSLRTGLELGFIKQFYQVDGDIVNDSFSCLTSLNGICQDENNDGVVDHQDEYLRIRNEVERNKLQKDYHSIGAYFSDTVKYGDWTYYAGIRADYDSTLENLNFSPRVTTQWDVFSDQSTRLKAGVNRYYGRNFFQYEVNSTLRSWRTSTSYNKDGTVKKVSSRDDKSLSDYDLKTPYSNEISIGVVQKIGFLDASLQFVNRESRDIVTRAETSDGLDYYSNEGRSSTDTVSLTLSARNPLELGSTKTYGSFSISYQESETNTLKPASYEDPISSKEIYYKGSVIYESQLPKSDFNIPYNVNFATRTEFLNWHVIWANTINVKSGGTIAKDTKEDYANDIPIYDDLKFDELITLDTSIEWKPTLFQSVEGYLKVSIDNVFDDYIDVSTDQKSYSYTLGRSTSIEVGMRF